MCLHIKEAGALAPGYQVDTVYFGGGTPSFLGADGLVQILNAIRAGLQCRPMQRLPLRPIRIL